MKPIATSPLLLLVLAQGCGRGWVYDAAAAPPANGSATSAGSSAASTALSAASSSVAPSTTAAPSLGGSSSSGSTPTPSSTRGAESSGARTSSASTSGSSGSSSGSSSSGSSSSCPAVACDSPPDCTSAIVSIQGGCPTCVVSCGFSPFDGAWAGTANVNMDGIVAGWFGQGPDIETVQQNGDGVLEFQYLDDYLVSCTLPWVTADGGPESAVLVSGACQDGWGETWSFGGGTATLDATGCFLTEEYWGYVTDSSYGGTGSFRSSSTLERVSCFGDGGVGSACMTDFGSDYYGEGAALNAAMACNWGLDCIFSDADDLAEDYGPGTCEVPSAGDPCLPDAGCVAGDECWGAGPLEPTCYQTCTDASDCAAPDVCVASGPGLAICFPPFCNGYGGSCTMPAADGGVAVGCCSVIPPPEPSPAPPHLPTPLYCTLDLDAGCLP